MNRPTRVERKDGSVYVEHYRPTERGYWDEAIKYYWLNERHDSMIICQVQVWVELK